MNNFISVLQFSWILALSRHSANLFMRRRISRFNFRFSRKSNNIKLRKRGKRRSGNCATRRGQVYKRKSLLYKDWRARFRQVSGVLNYFCFGRNLNVLIGEVVPQAFSIEFQIFLKKKCDMYLYHINYNELLYGLQKNYTYYPNNFWRNLLIMDNTEMECSGGGVFVLVGSGSFTEFLENAQMYLDFENYIWKRFRTGLRSTWLDSDVCFFSYPHKLSLNMTSLLLINYVYFLFVKILFQIYFYYFTCFCIVNKYNYFKNAYV